MQPTLELHPELHQVFNFAENTQSSGCCCWWRSKPITYTVSKDRVLVPSPSVLSFKEKLVAERRLIDIIKVSLGDDAIENEKAFQRLKLKVNDSLDKGDPITEKRLAKIVNAIFELKKEYT